MDTMPLVALGVLATGLGIVVAILIIFRTRLAHDYRNDHHITGLVTHYIAGTILWTVPGGIAAWIWNTVCALTIPERTSPLVIVILVPMVNFLFLIVSLISVGITVMYLQWSDELHKNDELNHAIQVCEGLHNGGAFGGLSSSQTM